MSQQEFFAVEVSAEASGLQPRRDLDQFFTPAWAAEAIIRQKFAALSADDRVLDPGCGSGAFLRAIPNHVPAIGVEIDPQLAAAAVANSGREVIVGDFRAVELPFRPTVIVGNPPFSREIADSFLARCADELPANGRMGFILPTSYLSFAGTLARWHREFSIAHDCLPRNLFPRISVPLSFFLFTRDRVRRLSGFLLYPEALAVGGTPKNVRLALCEGRPRKGAWRHAVEQAMLALGGAATLPQLYAYLSGRLPKAIHFWRDTVRRVLQEGGFRRVDRGVWELVPSAT